MSPALMRIRNGISQFAAVSAPTRCPITVLKFIIGKKKTYFWRVIIIRYI